MTARLLLVDDNAAQVELTQGSLNLRVRRLYDGQTYEIDTPTLAFVANRVGEFRVDVQPDGRVLFNGQRLGNSEVAALEELCQAQAKPR